MEKKLYIPIRIHSEANLSCHWTKKYKRKKTQRLAIRAKLNTIKEIPKLPVEITLTRIAPRALDFDNLVAAQKGNIDTIADFLIPNLQPGRADGDKRLSFKYEQRRGAPKEYGLEITIEEINE